MKFLPILLTFLIPVAFGDSLVSPDIYSDLSPLTLPIYEEFLSKIQQYISLESSRIQGRIILGKPATLGQFPYQILLRTIEASTNYTYMCGGSIISSQWILTAAHCVYGMASATVYAGIIDRFGSAEWTSAITKSQLIPHELFNTTSLYNDIALIGPVSVTFSNFVQPIAIPTAQDASISLNRRIGDISGWGRTLDGQTPQYLQYAQRAIVDDKVCKNVFGNYYLNGFNVCLDTQTRRSPCRGDSGGPLTAMISSKKLQVGVVSYGAASGCSLEFPAVFTRVSGFLDWINGKTGI